MKDLAERIAKLSIRAGICAGCSAEIAECEVQLCEWCGMDGLGNCCIGDLDHHPNGDDCPGADGRGP